MEIYQEKCETIEEIERVLKQLAEIGETKVVVIIACGCGKCENKKCSPENCPIPRGRA